jgi:hypothetical protein
MTRSDSDEAIQDFTHGSGLLRCARHDGVKPYFRVLATQGIRGFANRPSLPQRAQGKPGAGRTRSLACEDLGTPAKSLQVRPMRPGLPCATVLTAYLVLSPERPACLSPSPAGYRPADLAPAAGAPGHTPLPSAKSPFVRANELHAGALRPSHPALHVLVTIGLTPLCNRGGMPSLCTISDFRKEKISTQEPRNSNVLGFAREFRFSEHAILQALKRNRRVVWFESRESQAAPASVCAPAACGFRRAAVA